MQDKSEAFTAFQRFKALVEKKAGMPIKVLCKDHGGEYKSQEFEDFCSQHGMKQLTAAAKRCVREEKSHDP